MPWTRLSASCSSSSSSVCSRTKLCLRLGTAFSIGDGSRDEPELNDNSPELSLFSGSRCYVSCGEIESAKALRNGSGASWTEGRFVGNRSSISIILFATPGSGPVVFANWQILFVSCSEWAVAAEPVIQRSQWVTARQGKPYGS